MKRFTSIFTALAIILTLTATASAQDVSSAPAAADDGAVNAGGVSLFAADPDTCEHDWHETGEIRANCTDCRQIIMECSLCQSQKLVPDESQQPLGHIETTMIVVKKPTCKSTGVQYYVCDRCGRAVDSEIEKIDHHYVNTGTTPATCTEGGKIKQECTMCYGVREISDGASPLGHSFDENGICTTCGVYRISDEDELISFSEAVNGGNVNINAVMTADVVCTRAWTPIGTYNNRYMGTFDGQGHTISGLNYSNSTEDCVGLFAFVGADGQVLQTGVINSSITGKQEVGGISGRNKGVIKNCFSIVELGGADYIGGICGVNYGTIEDCYSVVKMKEDQGKGGVCGSETATSSISNCWYNSDIYCRDNGIGTGISTFGMISDKALSLMNLDPEIWAVKPYDSTTLYFPGFKSTSNFPAFTYEAGLSISYDGTEPAMMADELKFNVDARMKLGENFGDFSVINQNNIDKLELYANVKLAADMTIDTDGITAKITDSVAAGKQTFTVKFAGHKLFDGLTADKPLHIMISNLTASNFVFTAPEEPVYSGAAHTATVVPATGVTGVGKITLKYYDQDGNEKEPVLPGVYTVKIDVEGNDLYPAAVGLTDESWTFTIAKAVRTIPDTELPFIWTDHGVKSVEIKGLPDDTGPAEEPVIMLEDAGSIGILPESISFTNGTVSFELPVSDQSAAGKSAKITVTLRTQNYEDITFSVPVLLTDKKPQDAPECALSVQPSGTGFTVTIEPVSGAEYKFNDLDWSSVNKLDNVPHDTEVIAYIRMAETATLSPGAAATASVRTGHGELARHEAVSPACTVNGSTEYWSCDECRRYFSDPDGKNEISYESTVVPSKGHTQGEPVKENETPATCKAHGSYSEVIYCTECNAEISRKTVTTPMLEHSWSEEYQSSASGHWHICRNCGDGSEVQPHISGGPATYSKPEACTVCGFEISPKKTGGSSIGGSARTSIANKTKETLPSMNGKEISWGDIAAMLEKLTPGSHAVIELNGKTDVSENIFTIASKNRLTLEFVLDSVKSWIVDGAKLTAVSAADLSILPGKTDKSALRGAVGADLKVSGTDIPAGLKLNVRKEFAGYFANLYKSVNGKLEFQGCGRVNEDGSVTLPGANSAGDYVVMICRFSDLPGDMNNDGALNALDASALLKHIIGLAAGENPEVSDLNGDNTVNALDAAIILKKAAGL